jgi:hypothetical protein
VDECVDGASVLGVLNLADVFELVIDGFNQGPLPEKDFIREIQDAKSEGEIYESIWMVTPKMSMQL